MALAKKERVLTNHAKAAKDDEVKAHQLKSVCSHQTCINSAFLAACACNVGFLPGVETLQEAVYMMYQDDLCASGRWPAVEGNTIPPSFIANNPTGSF